MEVGRRTFIKSISGGLTGIVASAFVPYETHAQTTPQLTSLPKRFSEWMNNYEKAHPENIKQPLKFDYTEPEKLEIRIYLHGNGNGTVHVIEGRKTYVGDLSENGLLFNVAVAGRHTADTVREGLNPTIEDHYEDPNLDGEIEGYSKSREERYVSGLSLLTSILVPYQKADKMKPEERIKRQQAFNEHFARFFEILNAKIKN